MKEISGVLGNASFGDFLTCFHGQILTFRGFWAKSRLGRGGTAPKRAAGVPATVLSDAQAGGPQNYTIWVGGHHGAALQVEKTSFFKILTCQDFDVWHPSRQNPEPDREKQVRPESRPTRCYEKLRKEFTTLPHRVAISQTPFPQNPDRCQDLGLAHRFSRLLDISRRVPQKKPVELMKGMG